MASKKITLKIFKPLNTIWHEDSKLVFKSRTEHVVIGKWIDENLKKLSSKDVDECGKLKFKYDGNQVIAEEEEKEEKEEEENLAEEAGDEDVEEAGGEGEVEAGGEGEVEAGDEEVGDEEKENLAFIFSIIKKERSIP